MSKAPELRRSWSAFADCSYEVSTARGSRPVVAASLTVRALPAGRRGIPASAEAGARRPRSNPAVLDAELVDHVEFGPGVTTPRTHASVTLRVRSPVRNGD